MMREIMYFESPKQDLCHKLGQFLMRPLSVLCGHTYTADGKNIPVSTMKKVMLVALAVLTLPLSSLYIPLGILLTHLSKTHEASFEKWEEEERKSCEFYSPLGQDRYARRRGSSPPDVITEQGKKEQTGPQRWALRTPSHSSIPKIQTPDIQRFPFLNFQKKDYTDTTSPSVRGGPSGSSTVSPRSRTLSESSGQGM